MDKPRAGRRSYPHNARSFLLLLVLVAPATLPQGETGLVRGRLLLPDGKPSSGVRVVAEETGGEAAEVFAAASQTDASGAYRLENLPPGRYYIRAGLLESPTYYPGAATRQEARVITVERGAVLSGVDFVLLRGAGVRLSGRVVLDPRQQPLPQLRRVSLARGAPFVAEVATDENGAFEFSGVPPGSYSIVIRGAAVTNRNEVIGIRVGEENIAGIELRVPLLYEVAARMVVENGPLPKRPVGVFFVGSDELRGRQTQFLSDAPISALFPEGSYRAVVNDIPEGYAVTSIVHGPLDLTQERLKIPNADDSAIVVTVRVRP